MKKTSIFTSSPGGSQAFTVCFYRINFSRILDTGVQKHRCQVLNLDSTLKPVKNQDLTPSDKNVKRKLLKDRKFRNRVTALSKQLIKSQ